jgi:hypothetical protein
LNIEYNNNSNFKKILVDDLVENDTKYKQKVMDIITPFLIQNAHFTEQKNKKV